MEIIEKSNGMHVPIRLFLDKKIYPNNHSVSVLKHIAKINKLHDAVVCLPDLHYKYGQYSPTGMVVATKNTIIPRLANSDCGMSLIKTGMKSDLSDNEIDNLFGELKKRIVPKLWNKKIVSETDLKKICMSGLNWSEANGYDKANILNTECHGNMVNSNEFSFNLPSYIKKMGQITLGALGTGNHFLEMQEVTDIFDKKAAEGFGIKKGDLVIMTHTDSGLFGKTIHERSLRLVRDIEAARYAYKSIFYRLYLLRGEKQSFEKKFLKGMHDRLLSMYRFVSWKSKKVRDAATKEFKMINADSKVGKKYAFLGNMASNYGFVNRASINQTIIELLDDIKKSNKIVLYDGNHDGFAREDIEGEKLWIHRNGTSRAYPKKYFKENKLFSQYGQPLMVPGSMGDASYICTAVGNKNSFYSANHGAGRILDKIETHGKISEDMVSKHMKKNKIKLYRLNAGNIVEDAPMAYKDVNKIVDIMKTQDLAMPVAKVRPVAVLKGS